MSTLLQLRESLGRTWENLSEGWRNLYERASDALTKFVPVHRENRGNEETTVGSVPMLSPRWGLIAADVFDDDEQVVVSLEAPGMHRDDFDVEVVDGTLVIRGEKKFRRERTRGQYQLLECAYGRFERAIPLPAEVEDAKAKASYRDGVLRISLPKTANQRGRRIKIAAG